MAARAYRRNGLEIDPATEEPSPYILVRDRLEALIARPVFYELVNLAESRKVKGEKLLGVWSGGEFFPLGPESSGGEDLAYA